MALKIEGRKKGEEKLLRENMANIKRNNHSFSTILPISLVRTFLIDGNCIGHWTHWREKDTQPSNYMSLF